MEIITRDSIDYRVEGHSLSEILNYNEYLVLNVMREELARDESLCRCPLCVEDVFALAMNSLPPRYIQTTSAKTYETSKHFINEDEVRDKVAKAFATVKGHPNH